MWANNTIHNEPEQTGIEFLNLQILIDEWRAGFKWNPNE